MPSYSLENLADFDANRRRTRAAWTRLLNRIVWRRYDTALGAEYGKHGLARRMGMLVRCVDRVFELLPPERDEKPPREDVVDATVFLQAFVFNLYGCCDNLAWIWNHERKLNLPKKRVGLGDVYLDMRASFPEPIRQYLASRDGWLKHLTDFRDALAHRIPLYIPPYVVAPEREAEYHQLDRDIMAAAGAGKLDEWRALIEQQDAIGVFKPFMTHSFSENAKHVMLHPQMLCDFMTIDEMTRTILDELDRGSANNPPP